MNRTLRSKFDKTDRKVAFVLTLLVSAIVVLTLTQDFLRSDLKNSKFYFSESFLFSSFWWLFAPLLFIQYLTVKYKNKNRVEFYMAVIIFPVFFTSLLFHSWFGYFLQSFITILFPLIKLSGIPYPNIYTCCC